MGLLSHKTVRVEFNGSNISKLLMAFNAKAVGYKIAVELEYIDGNAAEFDPCGACAKREDVQMSLAFGSGPTTLFAGKIESAESSKTMDARHVNKVVFEGEPL